MKLLINSINKGSEIHPIYQMNITANNTCSFPQQLLHTIINNQNLSGRKKPSRL